MSNKCWIITVDDCLESGTLGQDMFKTVDDLVASLNEEDSRRIAAQALPVQALHLVILAHLSMRRELTYYVDNVKYTLIESDAA